MKQSFDWPMIRASYERGLSPNEIVRTLPNMPTRHAIEKRAVKEGWQVAIVPSGEVTFNDGDPKAVVLAKIRSGSPQKLAALAAGIAESTLYDWMNADPSFRSLVQASRAAYLTTNIERIHQAGARDWRAAAYGLERAPETRDQYGATKQEGGLTIVLQIDRSEGITIDGAPVSLQPAARSDDDTRQLTQAGE